MSVVVVVDPLLVWSGTVPQTDHVVVLSDFVLFMKVSVYKVSLVYLNL